jgi:hypothetical protein
MREFYDFSKGFKRPELAQRLRKYGCRVTITDGDGDDAKIIEQYIVPPDEDCAQEREAQ